jgi:hypothetical protein
VDGDLLFCLEEYTNTVSSAGSLDYKGGLARNTTGRVGEAMFDSQCTKRSISVLIPYCEGLPYDRVIDVRGQLLRVQIKSSNPGVNGGYTFSSPAKTYSGRKYTGAGAAFDCNKFDIMAIYFFDAELFWFLPSPVVHGRSSVSISDRGNTRWGVHNTGWSALHLARPRV